MEELQYQYGRSSNGASTNPYDVKVRSMNDNKMWVSNNNTTSSSWYSYEAPKERYVTTKVTKSKKTDSWWNNPERKRKRRVAKYKLYTSEGKFKQSVKNGFRWLKIKCFKFVTNF
ncbi:uncharacterized protein LOC133314467 [Gastrolobium bilobum]|uniref:uncharacterized protein LOC133314467 n=1 Tax=Gastrolobium bilobum TaxID=150636 RepID=UPI002AB201AE|nr:uncharacterized protein LOC133314467 [Gastrolobium bilobum]